MVRAIGFQQGLRGDICMSTVAARSFKEQYPDSHLTLGVHRQFKDLLPLFHDHPFYDSFHVYDTYDGWPGQKDSTYLAAARYDMVFRAMPAHRDNWWEHRHQYAETAHMVGLPVPSDIKPVLTRWFNLDSDYRHHVALAAFGGNAQVNDKQLTVAQAQGIVDHLRGKGYRVLQLGAPSEPSLDGADQFVGTYFEAVQLMLSCRALIHCDTGMGHFAGAYGQASLGIYGWRYHGEAGLRHIQPLHDAFVAVQGPHVDQISLDTIAKGIDTLLA